MENAVPETNTLTDSISDPLTGLSADRLDAQGVWHINPMPSDEEVHPDDRLFPIGS